MSSRCSSTIAPGQNRSSQRSTRPEKSIAVLPFENLSDDKGNAFFADGIQDDVLTSLAKIHDLKVISRTSVMAYRKIAARNLREIGQALGVVNILEGSVRRQGDRVVVNVQLVDAQTARNLWADRYDRTIANSLGLQGELASEIAAALSATLSPEEKSLVASKPTNNADAYILYLQARQLETNPDTLLQDFKMADRLYTQAVALDPAFALAHARLAQTSAKIFHFHERTGAWKTKAKTESEEALRLQPNLGEAHHALALYLYWVESDYARARREFETAARLSPGGTEPAFLLAAIRRREGRWRDALAAYNQIATLDPQNPNVVRNLLYTNTAIRDWPVAARAAERLRVLAPDSAALRIQAAYVDFWWHGSTAALKATLAKMPAGLDPDGVVSAGRWDVSMIERDYASAEQALRACQLDEVSYLKIQPTAKSFLQGALALARGDAAGAQKPFELARVKFEAAVQETPANAEGHANLGLLYAFLGRKDEAVREGLRAVELKPETKDALDGTIMNCYLALIYARVGAPDLALPLIERLLQTPGAVDSANYSMTMNDLKFRWEWDPLRNDPRFQKILSGPEPKTAYK